MANERTPSPAPLSRQEVFDRRMAEEEHKILTFSQDLYGFAGLLHDDLITEDEFFGRLINYHDPLQYTYYSDNNKPLDVEVTEDKKIKIKSQDLGPQLQVRMVVTVTLDENDKIVTTYQAESTDFENGRLGEPVTENFIFTGLIVGTSVSGFTQEEWAQQVIWDFENIGGPPPEVDNRETVNFLDDQSLLNGAFLEVSPKTEGKDVDFLSSPEFKEVHDLFEES